MGKRRRILLGTWIIANALVLSLLALNPMVERQRCDAIFGERSCFRLDEPLVSRRYLIAGAIFGNGVALAAWVVTRRN